LACGCKGNRAAADARNTQRAAQVEQRRTEVEAARRMLKEGIVPKIVKRA